MSTDIINDAGEASRNLKGMRNRLRQLVDSLDLTSNACGVIIDQGRLLADLDGIVRTTGHMQTLILDTHWPTEAEYREV